MSSLLSTKNSLNCSVPLILVFAPKIACLEPHISRQFVLGMYRRVPGHCSPYKIVSWIRPRPLCRSKNIKEFRRLKTTKKNIFHVNLFFFGILNLVFGTMNLNFGVTNLRINEFSEQRTFGTTDLRNNGPSEKRAVPVNRLHETYERLTLDLAMKRLIHETYDSMV